MNRKYIAIIYEGQKTERILIKNLNQCFFADNIELVPITFPAGENIYMLWRQLKEDDFQTDIIEVIREYSEDAKAILDGYTRDDFMEIYLFFDYDGHTNNNRREGLSVSEILNQMLETFSDETDLGKLYVNYPMVESIRDNLKDEVCYRRCSIPISEINNYKHTVHELKEYQDFRKYTVEDWKIFCRNAVSKLNCLVNNTYKIPSRNDFLSCMSQLELFQKQLTKIIDGQIAVINSFPLFLLEYFKPEFWEKMLNSEEIKS